MTPFVYQPGASRVVFGQGSLTGLPTELLGLGIHKPLIITTPFQQSEGEKLLAMEGMPQGVVCSHAVMHTPCDVTEQALALLREHQCDGLVALGGGSTIGLAKALALRTQLPQVAIPTTYAGSEVTPILGETQDGVKKTQRTPRLLPNVVIYDVNTTLSLPAAMTASSGLNAIAHAVEALYAHDTNPVIQLMAQEGIRALSQSLPVLMQDTASLAARTQAQYGAWLCGVCLGSVAMALHHKLCHVLGGAFNLPHAETHAVVLPYAMAYNAPTTAEAMKRIAVALGGTSDTPQPWLNLHGMLVTLKLPTSLKALGMPEDGVARALELVFQDKYRNPRPLEPDAIQALLEAAYHGHPPRP